jgi:hypothetical protein
MQNELILLGLLPLAETGYKPQRIARLEARKVGHSQEDPQSPYRVG